MPASIKVIIVDDHPLVRSGLRHAIKTDSRLEVAGEAGDGPTALAMIQEKEPDVAMLDVNLPGLSGLEIARQLQHKKLRTRLIILTMHKDEETCNRALDFGAKGFVLKENAEEEVVQSILAVARGEHYLSPSISGYLVRRKRGADALAARKPGIEDLTKAERRVLALVAQNKTSRLIAAELFISERTVEAHRAHICAKLDLHGAHSLLQFALENRSAL